MRTDISQEVLKKTFSLPNGSEEQILTDNSESDLLRSSNEKNTYAYDPEKFANRYKLWGTPSQAYGVTAQGSHRSTAQKGDTWKLLKETSPREQTWWQWLCSHFPFDSFRKTTFMGKGEAEFLNSP